MEVDAAAVAEAAAEIDRFPAMSAPFPAFRVSALGETLRT